MSEINMPSVLDILQHVSDQICDKYCKWPDICLAEKKDPDEAEELLLGTYCDGCPLHRLI